MSSAHNPNYRPSRTLLQSRSLHDFSTPPPPPRPEKSRRRVLQVNGPYFVREVCPPIPRIDKPGHAELVQTPQNLRSQSPASSMQASPFIAAPRTSYDVGTFSPTSSYGTPPPVAAHYSALPADKGVHELRNPPVDPRRHRRLCSDFGLDRDRDNFKAQASPSPPVPEISSLASTPLASYTETESDSDASAHEALDYAFPEPPPFDEALHLRRMHSSFDLGETDKVREYLRKRWGVTQALKGSNDQWDGVSRISMNSQYTSNIEDLDISRSTINRIHTESPRAPHTPRKPNVSTPSSRTGEDIAWKRATTAPMPRDDKSGGPGPSLHLTRSASSIGNLTTRSAANTPLGTAVRSPRLPPELSEPMGRLDLSIEKLRTHDPYQFQSNRAAVVVNDHRKPHLPLLPLSPPSLASAGRKKPPHRPHHSAPVPAAGFVHTSTNANTMPASPPPHDLGMAFSHRATQSQPTVRPHLRQPDQPVPRSFMDITPEREAQRSGSRTRMRKLLARASVGMFSWGKNLSKTKSNSK